MDFSLDDEHRMLADLVARFVTNELLPLEPALLAREARGEGAYLAPQERNHLDTLSRSLGLWGLDAPQDVGGVDLPQVALVAVNEQLGRTPLQYTLPPDSPNLRMLMATVNAEQRERYLAPYVRGEKASAIAISEPGAGSDPRAMTTTAVESAEGWLLNGRKLWISRAEESEFSIVMAQTVRTTGEKAGISAFLVDRETPGFVVERKIQMIGGSATYEVRFDDCLIAAGQLLGSVGNGFGPMQARLATRRLEVGAWCVGAAQRALDMLCDYAPQRVTFGQPLAERQAVQWWVADAAIRIHAARLMLYDAAWKIDQGRDVQSEVSIIKVYAPETASEVIDHAMQAFGAMGMTKELPLHLMADQVRTMRIYDGPSEVHRWVVARKLLGLRK